MTSQLYKKQMRNFIENLLTHSPYLELVPSKINDPNFKDNLAIQYVDEQTHLPQIAEIFIHTHKPTIEQRSLMLVKARFNVVSLIDILDKNGIDYFVRLAENESWRTQQSFKKYTSQQINQLIHLREIEKTVRKETGNRLVYYQPETVRLPQSVRIISFSPAYLDYSHLSTDTYKGAFSTPGYSIEYMFPQEIARITENDSLRVKQDERKQPYFVKA